MYDEQHDETKIDPVIVTDGELTEMSKKNQTTTSIGDEHDEETETECYLTFQDLAKDVVLEKAEKVEGLYREEEERTTDQEEWIEPGGAR